MTESRWIIITTAPSGRGCRATTPLSSRGGGVSCRGWASRTTDPRATKKKKKRTWVDCPLARRTRGRNRRGFFYLEHHWAPPSTRQIDTFFIFKSDSTELGIFHIFGNWNSFGGEGNGLDRRGQMRKTTMFFCQPGGIKQNLAYTKQMVQKPAWERADVYGGRVRDLSPKLLRDNTYICLHTTT